ncbi:hypothetical protein EC991_004779 [Linnemannia zychae]|nr:hypothetical protein EC991_004779 [Linnemannia zychae]
MAWIGRALGTGARGVPRGENQSHRWTSYLHTTGSSPSSTLLTARSRIPTHSTTTTHAHCRRIHSSSKSCKHTPNTADSTATVSALGSQKPSVNPAAATKKPTNRSTYLLRNSYNWTPELDAKILDMRLEGSTWHEIGAALGRDHAACHQRYIKELDPALHNRWSPDKIEQLNSMVAAGKSWRYISDRMLITQAICRDKWMSLNQDLVQKAKELKKLERPRPIRPPRQSGSSTVETYRKVGLLSAAKYRWCNYMEALLLELKDRGLNWRQIGSVFGVAPMTCYMRYQHRLRPQLKNGWTPPKLDNSNMPYYLLPQRIRPLPPALKTTDGATTDLAQSISTQSAVTVLSEGGGAGAGFIPWLRTKNSFPTDSSVPLGLIGVLSDDYTYDIKEPEIDLSRTWTPEEDAAIIKGRELGASFKTMGEKLNIDPRLCHNRFHTVLDKNGKRKGWTPELVEKLRFYVEQGLSWSNIASELGFHRIICRDKYREISRSPAQSSESNGASSHPLGATSASGTLTSATDSESDMSNDSDVEDHPDLEDRSRDMLEEYYDNDDEEDYSDEDDTPEEDNDGNNDDDAIMDMDGLEDSESIDEDDSMIVSMRSRTTQQKTRPSHPSIFQSIWDQESYMRELQKLWTTSEETTLIRHVIRHGTRAWDKIAEALGGKHSAEECRAYWKFLDMPVVRHDRQPFKWGLLSEAQFWQLWLDKGSNFNEIASALTEESRRSDAVDGTGGNATVFEAKDCENLFVARTKHLLGNAGVHGEGSLNDDQLQKAYVEVALARSKPAPFKWNKEKSVTLQKIVRQRLKTRGVQIDWINWKWVARHVGDGATAQRCCMHWRQLRRAEMEKDLWTNENILLLEQGIREVGPIFNEKDSASGEPTLAGFRAIQRFYLPSHDVQSIQRKYFLLSDKATEVTVQEYMAILDGVDEYGEHHWDKVVKSLRALPSSSASSSQDSTSSLSKPSSDATATGTGWTKAPCRRVWEASYKHNLVYTPWSPTEDLDLRESVEHLGLKDWALISRFFPGKSAWQCRLRWCQITDPLYQPPTSSSSSPDSTLHSTTASQP